MHTRNDDWLHKVYHSTWFKLEDIQSCSGFFDTESYYSKANRVHSGFVCSTPVVDEHITKSYSYGTMH